MGQESLSEVYRRQQDQLEARHFDHRRFRIACWIQVVAAVIGPLSSGPVSLGLFVSVPFVVCSLPSLVLSVIMIILVRRAMREESSEKAYLAGLLGLLQMTFFFVGAILSLASLVVIRSAHKARPRIARIS